ncbi:MAG: aminotransferase class I/II-fold pyridoxal phosphate-dependent enzyme [bacterium]
MSLLSELISNKIEKNKKLGLYRKIPDCPDKNTNNGFINYSTGTVNLATNDYLGLSKNENIKKAAKKAVDLYGTSASSSFLICGHSDIHIELEKELCELKGGYESCILYPSGYQANTGIIKSLSSVLPLKTFIAFDELSHASIIDGVLASGVKFKSFKHNDLNNLESILDKYKSCEIKIVITEGVFSMDGDIPDLPNLLNIAKRYDALSIVDDAHATGTIGAKGGGSADFHKVKPDIIIGTLGKALASNGAFAISNRLIIEYLINFSRTFIFSTGIPPSSAASALEAVKLIKENPEIVEILQKNSEYARKYISGSGLNTLNSSTHIIPILIGEEDKAVLIEKELLEMGIYLKAVRYPTVPIKSARLRLGVSTAIDGATLKSALKDIVDKIKKIQAIK